MIAGIFLIVAGILIAFYPPLLSIIVAVVLIMTGLSIAMMSYRFKKMERKFKDNPFMDFFARF